MTTFVIFGRALLKAIDKSLQNQKNQQQQARSTEEELRGTKGGSAGDHTLQDARRKVKTVVGVDVVMVSSGALVTIVAVTTGFDMEVPLVMFGVTFAFLPLIWLSFNIQVHGGRSGSHGRMVSPLSSGRVLRSGPTIPRSMLLSARKHQEEQVVPTESPC